jgi:hypothetical protein
MSRTTSVLGRIALVTAGALMGTALLVPGGAQAAEVQGATKAQSTNARPVLSSEFGKAKSRIEGTFGKAGVVTGTFTPREFKVNKAGLLKAVGRLDATLVRGNGHVAGKTSKRVTMTVASIEGTSLEQARTAARAPSCGILNLVLGPLDLDLLGLQVHLDKVVLNIIAATGAGNLLGNLLCAVAGLLDGTGALSELLPQISQILNSILAILRL